MTRKVGSGSGIRDKHPGSATLTMIVLNCVPTQFQVIYGRCDKDSGMLLTLESVWPRLMALYEPWLLPLKPGARPTTANWIQQLTDETTSLLPWYVYISMRIGYQVPIVPVNFLVQCSSYGARPTTANWVQ
jgi:hypothetical protein